MSQHTTTVLFLSCLDQHVTTHADRLHQQQPQSRLSKLEKSCEVERDFRVNKNCKQVEVMLVVFWIHFNGKLYVVKKKKLWKKSWTRHKQRMLQRTACITVGTVRSSISEVHLTLYFTFSCLWSFCL